MEAKKEQSGAVRVKDPLKDGYAAEREYSVGQLDHGLSISARNYKYGGMGLGVVLAAVVYFLIPTHEPHELRITAAVAVLMGVWWITEAIPLAATALMPLILFPALAGTEFPEVAKSYSNSTIFLFLGGFMLALALQRWNLHKRIAIKVVLIVGTKPKRLIAGFMIATAFLSMWVSNTATAMMMIPMAMSLVSLLEDQEVLPAHSKFGSGLIIGTAYAATIGGMGTMIGSPINVVTVTYIRESLSYPVTFLEWAMVGIPATVIVGIAGWALIVYGVWRPEVDELPGGRELFERRLKELGPFHGGERLVAVVFAVTAIAWVFVPLIWGTGHWLSDTTIALIAGLIVMILPAKPRDGVMLMTWKDAHDIPWDVLLLIGGGLALSGQITNSGLSAEIGARLSVLQYAPQWVLVGAVTLLLLLLTELTSSTATSAAFVPVVGGLAMSIGQDPVAMAIAAAIGCSGAFMLPVGTPPNAIAFSTGAIKMGEMVKTGVWMNLTAWLLGIGIILTIVPAVFSA